MQSDSPAKHEQLFADFPDLAAEGVDLPKEIHAHFRRVFSRFALLEAAMQNAYIYSSLLAKDRSGAIYTHSERLSEHASLEKRALAATFGSLIKLLEAVPEIQTHLDELRDLKKTRDHFAHNFFREQNPLMFKPFKQVDLLAEMNWQHGKIQAAEKLVDRVVFELQRKLYPDHDLEKTITEVDATLRAQQASDTFRGFV